MIMRNRDRAERLARFNELHEHLDPHLDRLLACEPHSRDPRPGAKHVAVPHLAGVYLFTEAGNDRYIGRAKDLNHRFGQHVAAGSRHNQAGFAFNIAKRDAEHAGFRIAGVKREDLDVDGQFNEQFFTPAKAQVRAMEFRFVLFNPEMPDIDALSTIFEVYASMVLGTEGDFNLFATH
jgi:hypothetical protein